ncbi:unnamed protein product [Absidia cylindrospora]
MLKVIINLQHALHPLLHIFYQVIVGIIKQIKNAVGYYQEKDLQTLLLNGSCSVYCNVRMDGDQVVSQNILTFSDVEWPIILVMCKNFFVAGQVFLWTLRKSSYRFYTLSVVSILILLMFLWFIGYCSAGATLSLDGYQVPSFTGFIEFLFLPLDLTQEHLSFCALSAVSILILLMFL